MNPLTLLQLLGPILKHLPPQAARQLMAGLKMEGRGSANAFKMLQRGANPGKSAIRDPSPMFDMAQKGARQQDEILSFLTEDLGRTYDMNQLDDARDMIQNIISNRPIYRRR